VVRSVQLRIAVVLLILVLVSGCATVDRRVPAYPARGQTMEQVAADQAHCRTWAEHNTADPGSSAVGGGAVGAVVLGGLGAAAGAVIYAAMGLNPGEGAAFGAALGGITGAIGGAGSSAESSSIQQSKAYTSCMVTRGYTVIP
jgi:uncharacterized protein YceK